MFFAAFAAGAINSIAGGGTLITFPVLIWLGLDPKVANGTSTVALWPGLFGGLFGYRRELENSSPILIRLGLTSIVGGAFGAWLLIWTPSPVFARLVPFLILFATCLFAAQEPIQRRFNLARAHESRSHWLSWTMLFQLLVGLYGGYFGAGIGILMLAALSLIGHTDIYQMNGVKNMLATCMNGIAAGLFIYYGLVIWQDAVLMMGGAILGGVGGASMARRVGRTAVRRTVIVVGVVMAAKTMWDAFGS